MCKALDVDSLFDGAVTEIVSGSEEGQAMLVSNIIAIVISLGCAATLWVLPRVGANNFAMGSRKACVAALGAAASIALIIAGLRFASDVASTVFESGEATAVLKDLAGVAKTLNDQGAQAEGAECGVVLLRRRAE